MTMTDPTAPAQLQSFAMLFEQYHAQIFRYFRTHQLIEEDAADLTQQVFAQAWAHRADYRPERGAFAGQLTYAEIATLLSKSEAATKKQIARLLHRLQERYRQGELDDLVPETPPLLVATLEQIYRLPVPRQLLANLNITNNPSERATT